MRTTFGPIQYHYLVTVRPKDSPYTEDHHIVARCEEEARDKARKYGKIISIESVWG